MAVRAAVPLTEGVIRVGNDVWSFSIPISAADLCRHLGLRNGASAAIIFEELFQSDSGEVNWEIPLSPPPPPPPPPLLEYSELLLWP